MYFNTSNTTLTAPAYIYDYRENFTKVIFYVDGIKLKNGINSSVVEADEKKVIFYVDGIKLKNGINSSVIGYNEKKEKEFETIDSMAYNNINLVTKKYIIANAALDDILELKDNWNDNGAKCFSRQLVEKCRAIVNDLVVEPFICPTACDSIQFEYEKEDGDYLEFEVFEDRIEVFSDTKDKGEHEDCLKGTAATDEMKQMVVEFYG